jgi:hypothetical protein
MLQLVYISTARQKPSIDELGAILAVSRRNNRATGITGLLLAGGRRFLQALEGPDAAVLAAFERIKSDPRHLGIVALSIAPVDRRAFGDWAMGFEAGGTVDGESDLGEVVRKLVAPLGDKSLRAQFEGFAALHAHAA